jgi:transcriptional regulator NrdR family protein
MGEHSSQLTEVAANTGLRCRKCGHGRFRVRYTRRKPGAVMRRRECRKCGARITTKEREIGC